MEEREDLYRILEVAPDADAQSIDEAYWRLVVRYQSAGEEMSEEGATCEDASMMDRVTRAYEVLCDPQRRAEYDRAGKRSARGGVRRFRVPRLPSGTLDSLGRTLASAAGAVLRLPKRLRPPRPSRRMALITGVAAVVAGGLVVAFVYPPDFGGEGDGPGMYPIGGGPAVSVAAVGPTPAPTGERTPTPASTAVPTPTPMVPQRTALDAGPALGEVLEALGQIEGRLQVLEGRLDSALDASSKDVPVGPSPTTAPSPTPTPAPRYTPTPEPVDPSTLDWIQRYQHENGELPPIPDWLAPLVDEAGEGDTIEDRKVLIPTSERWCHLLPPSDRLKFLQYVKWLGYHYEDWVWQVGRVIGDDWLSRCPPAGSY
ncbi:MAG: DnaJ domain-containing protein [Dehalococcoidia bacterium]|nr:DnaJ domain-containing protein [Dehalococcoidia bacterium]